MLLIFIRVTRFIFNGLWFVRKKYTEKREREVG